MKRFVTNISVGLALSLAQTTTAFAGLFSGREIDAGMGDAAAIQTGLSASGPGAIRTATENLLFTVLTYMGLLAVVVIIIGSIMLIAGLGSDESRDRIRKILIFTFVGFIIIAFAGAIVQFVLGFGS